MCGLANEKKKKTNLSSSDSTCSSNVDKLISSLSGSIFVSLLYSPALGGWLFNSQITHKKNSRRPVVHSNIYTTHLGQVTNRILFCCWFRKGVSFWKTLAISVYNRLTARRRPLNKVWCFCRWARRHGSQFGRLAILTAGYRDYERIWMCIHAVHVDVSESECVRYFNFLYNIYVYAQRIWWEYEWIVIFILFLLAIQICTTFF